MSGKLDDGVRAIVRNEIGAQEKATPIGDRASYGIDATLRLEALRLAVQEPHRLAECALDDARAYARFLIEGC